VKGILVDNLQPKVCAEQKYIVPLPLKLPWAVPLAVKTGNRLWMNIRNSRTACPIIRQSFRRMGTM
jgi:hypothetical protein